MNAGGSRSESDWILEIRDLKVHYGPALALDGISLTCRSHQRIAVLGANGAGKSTLLRAISGFASHEAGRVTSGEIILHGVPIHGAEPNQIAKRGVAIVPESAKVFEKLTVEENLKAVALVRRRDLARRLEQSYDLFPSLGRLRLQLAGYLSGGERQMLAIAMGLMGGANMLLVDELSLGLSPILVDTLLEALTDLHATRGLTVVLVEQAVPKALAFADFCYVFDQGRVVLSGPPADVGGKDDLVGAYLGGRRAPAVGGDSAGSGDALTRVELGTRGL